MGGLYYLTTCIQCQIMLSPLKNAFEKKKMLFVGKVYIGQYWFSLLYRLYISTLLLPPGKELDSSWTVFSTAGQGTVMRSECPPRTIYI